MRRVVLKSPVLENCTPGSVRGAPGNRRPYLATFSECALVGRSKHPTGADAPDSISAPAPYPGELTVRTGP